MRHENERGMGPGRGPGMRHRMRHLNRNRGSRLLLALLAGGGIAAFLTYKFAPKSWNSLTREIADAARNGWNQVENAADWVGDEAESLYDQAGDEAQTLYKAVKTEAGVIYEAAGKTVSSAEAAIAGTPQNLQDEKARVDTSVEAGKTAYVNGGDNANQKAAAAKVS